MFESMPQAENQKEAKPFRERTPVWKSIVEEGVESLLVDDVIERVASSENELYHLSRESGFREKIRTKAVEAIDALLQNDEKNFSYPIDAQTKRWDREIADSSEDPDKEISKHGDMLVKSLITLAGGKENLIEKVVTIMIEKETQKKSDDRRDAR